MRTQGTTRLVIDGKPLVDDHFSGVGNYTMHLLGALDRMLDDRSDLDVRLAIPSGRRARLGRYHHRHIRPLTIPIPHGTFRRLVEREQLPPMDLVCGPGVYFFPDFARWPLRRARSITAVHDLCFVQVPDMVHEANGAFLRRAVADAVAQSDAVTALTATMADEIVTTYGVPREKVDVVSCAVDTRHFYRRSATEIAEVTRRHGIFGDYIVAVGNFEPRKNHLRLIDAFRALPPELGERFTLVLVGAGAWKEEAIRERIGAALDEGRRVLMLQNQVPYADLPAVYTGATASAYVSVYEGFGMPPLESMACDTPVLAGNASVLPEVTGDAALGVDPTDTASITEGLVTILSDEATRDRLRLAGRHNISRFDWNAAAATLVQVVERVSEG
ncbi:MAG: glycosyltransferase family 4 protein [Actinobacteria bacterium]|nr:glycosyltransferase family 4 protein [Actinomycetota bacterium]